MDFRRYKLSKTIYSGLSKEDKAVLKILEGAVKDISKVYELQFQEGFYPRGVTKEQLEKAAQNNPEILSPFANVEQRDGKLEAVPYHVRFAKYLKPIAKKIEKASGICTNKSFKAYLKTRAKSLITGNYEEAYKLWLQVKNSKIDFTIVPHEQHLDKLFFIKRVFQAHIGIVNKTETKLAEQYKETLYSSAKMSFSKYHSTDIAKKGVRVQVQDIPIISGFPAAMLYSGQHFPYDLDKALKYGSKTIIYNSQLALKFEKLYYPIFKTIFEKRFASKYSKQLLLEASGLCILLYELGKQLHKFAGARDRLQEFYSPIDIANGFVSGIEHSKHLVVKGMLSQEQLEAIMITHVLCMLADWLVFKSNKARQNHMTGYSILLNSYLSHRALSVNSGVSWPNFSRIFFEIETMSYKLVYLLQKGSYQEAEEFINKNVSFNSFERLSRGLSKINTQI
ncbi:hypothetical protein HYZ06_02225 [Candidatus Daviesbacteria bacterium]|nr:hypothetical protein [Candidatus Daviesbacteria bacterium]